LPKSELQPAPALRRILERFCNGRVPEGWSLRRLDDLGARGTGHTPDRKKPHYWNGGVKWISLADSHRLDQVYISDTEYSISNAGLDNSSAVLHPPGIVVLSRDAGVGKSAVTTCPLAVSQHFVVWDCGSDLHNLYLYYWLQSMKPEFERIANGSTIKTIGMGYFDRLQILAPGREVQEPIAELLLTWDSAITAARKLVRRRRKLKRGFLQQLLIGDRRFPEFRDQPWVERKLGDVVKRITRTNTGGSKHALTISGRTGFVDQKKYFSKMIAGESIGDSYLIKRGEFAYNRSLMKGYPFGATKRLNTFDEGVVSKLYIVFAIRNPDELDSDFLRHLFESGVLNRQLCRITNLGARAHGLLNIVTDDFFDVTLCIPPVPEQRRIADTLDTLDREIQLLHDLQEALKEQKKGLMQQLLTGKVRVPPSMLKEAAHA
jgi:type I restriction enzyme S subunit